MKRAPNRCGSAALIQNRPDRFVTAKKDTSARDLKELIAWLKANPDKAS
jgi:hypothetical protein